MQIMLPGDLLCKFMKERLEENLEFFKDMVKRDLDRQPEKVNLQVRLHAVQPAPVAATVLVHHPQLAGCKEQPLCGYTPHTLICSIQSSVHDLVNGLVLRDVLWALQDEEYIKPTSDKLPDVGKKMEYMLNTGNLVSKTGLDISQATGFTVVAEKLNFFR